MTESVESVGHQGATSWHNAAVTPDKSPGLRKARALFESDATEEDPMRGAWIVETVIAALVLLLVARSMGYAISAYSFFIALVPACIIVWGTRVLWKRIRP